MELGADRLRTGELAKPVGEVLAQANLHAAHALDAAHEGQVPRLAVNHPCGLERTHHGRGAGHDRRVRWNGCI